MRAREKLTNEEKVALALDVLKRARPLHEICAYYQVSHTTAYNIRNTFLEGGRLALAGERDTHQRLRSLEQAVAKHAAIIAGARAELPVTAGPASVGLENGADHG